MTTASEKAGKDDFHRERSRFLDAFACLEEALCAAGSASMDEKLKGQLATLRAIRNDLVHSHFRFVQLDGQLQAIAVNAQNSQDIARNGRLLRITDFKTLNSQIGQVTKSVG